MVIVADLFQVNVPILEKIIRPALVYIFLVAALRLAGKRELAQINTFDLVVLLTLSNTVQNAIIGNDDSLLGGVIGASTLMALNAIVVRFMVGHPLLSKIIEGDADILVENGQLNEDRMKKEGITRQELEAAAHRQGFATLATVDKALLEAGGAITFTGKLPTEETLRYEALVERLEKLSQEIKGLRRQLNT